MRARLKVLNRTFLRCYAAAIASAPERRHCLPRRLLLLALLLLVGSVSGVEAREDASRWLGPALVSGPVNNAQGLQVEIAANGDAAAVWVEVGAHTSVIRYAIRPAGRRWQAPRNLSPVGQEARSPDLAIDGNGNAIAVWQASAGAHDVVEAAVRPAGGRFRPPRTVAQAEQSVIAGLGPPKVAVDRKGNTIAVWAGGIYSDPIVEVAAGTSRHGLRSPHPLSAGRFPEVAADASGSATIVWESNRGVEAAFRPAGGRFRAPQRLGAGAYTYPQLAVNARGDALVAWAGGSYPGLTVQAAFRKAGKPFGPAERVGSAGDLLLGLRAALDPRGNGIVLWRADRYDTSPLQAALRPSGGTFAATQILTPDAGAFALALDARGNTTAVWSRYGGDWVVQSATRARGGLRFGAPRDLSTPGYNALDPDIAADAAGNAVVVWQRSQGRDFIVQAVTRSVLKVSKPGSGSAGGQGSWLGWAVLSEAAAHEPRLAVDGRGNATAVWGTKNGTDQGVVQAAFRPVGGRFRAPQDISPPGLWAGPDLGVDEAGNATAVWASGSPPAVLVRAATRPAGGSFGPPHDLAQPDRLVFSPRIAVNARGDAAALWIASDGESYVVRAAFRPAGGTFGAPENVFNVGLEPQVPTFEVAIDSKGDAVAVWVATHPSHSVVQAAYRPTGGSFALPEMLAEAKGDSQFIEGPVVAMDAGGNAIAAWWNTGAIQTALRPAERGNWQPTEDLAKEQGCCGTRPALGADAEGNAIVAWGSDGTIKAAVRRLPAGSWQTPQTLSPSEDPAYGAPTVAVNAGGDVVVAWTPAVGVIAATVRPSGGTFGPARDVSQAGVVVASAPQVVIDPQGNAAIVWRSVRSALPRYSHLGYIQAATYRG